MPILLDGSSVANCEEVTENMNGEEEMFPTPQLVIKSRIPPNLNLGQPTFPKQINQP